MRLNQQCEAININVSYTTPRAANSFSQQRLLETTAWSTANRTQFGAGQWKERPLNHRKVV
jgi:hypothetical protein